MRQTTTDHEASMPELKRKQEEAFVVFKMNTLGMLSDVTTELKSNIFLHTQVSIGPFDIFKMISMLSLR